MIQNITEQDKLFQMMDDLRQKQLEIFDMTIDQIAPKIPNLDQNEHDSDQLMSSEKAKVFDDQKITKESEELVQKVDRITGSMKDISSQVDDIMKQLNVVMDKAEDAFNGSQDGQK